MPRKIHALLVAINEYAPTALVKPLFGPIKDKNKIKELLLERYQVPPARIQCLEGPQATRTAVITAFHDHLCDNTAIDPGDVVLFYFGGHGSCAPTALALANDNDPQKQDETLVCYDSRIPGPDNHDLADKEIAVLISRVKKGVEVVLIIDACHSGSITRDIETETEGDYISRHISADTNPRSLDSYLLPEDHFYTQMENVKAPERTHFALSACNRMQKAMERNKQGLFTKHLIASLEKADLHLSYLQLIDRINAAVQMDNRRQNPEIWCAGSANPHQLFLGTVIIDTLPKLRIFFRRGHWSLNYGAIYGLRTEKQIVRQMQVAVYREGEVDPEKSYLGMAEVEAVKLNECHLKPRLFDKLIPAEDKENFRFLDPEKLAKRYSYLADITAVPPNLFVYLNGSAADKKKFLRHLNPEQAPFISFVESPNPGLIYELEIVDDQLLIKKMANGFLVHGCEGTEEDSVFYILQKLEQIEVWERILHLENATTAIAPQEVEVRFQIRPNGDEFFGPDIYLDYQGEKIPYQIEVRNRSKQAFYIGMLYLHPKFGIESYFPCEKFEAEDQHWIPLKNNQSLVLVGAEVQSVTDVFKVIISSKEFDEEKLSRNKIVLGKIVSPSTTKDSIPDTPLAAEEDWCTRTLRVHLTRQKTALNRYDTQLNALNFKGHPSFKAQLGLGSISSNINNSHPATFLTKVFQQDSMEVVNLRENANDGPDQSIIQLNDIQQENTLVQTPLSFELTQALDPKKFLLPITFDGEHFLPLGHVQKTEDQRPIIQVDTLPDIQQHAEEEQTRSIQRALWFCLLKLTGDQDSSFKLRYIWKYENDKAVYGKQSGKELIPIVKNANKVLLLVHGIIGNTQMMANAIQALFGSDQYDLILTYDYENLNTSIESISERLDHQLAEIGINQSSFITIDVMAHSMGGLVLRYLIESLRKDQILVDKLLLFGTPNGGSDFSNLTKVRDAGLYLLTVVANASKYLMLPMAPWLYTLNAILAGTKPISTTLQQMHPDATFIKNLGYNDQQQETQYHIFAGNSKGYQADGNWWNQLKEKCTTLGLKPMYQDTPSDLVVSVDQIKQLPTSFAATLHEVTCHHMNYFETPEVLAIIFRLLKGEKIEKE